ncbi:MAG: hypothetical protein HC904_09040 [Blastochloris sp.]|nr:hypothetical protein [Blastochloris sp.]
MEALPQCLPCSNCQTPSYTLGFPASRPSVRRSHTPEPVQDEGESTCLYHNHYKASAICVSCGAFVCQLCEIHLHEEPICPACLRRQTQSGKNTLLKTKHYRWDCIALGLAVFTPITIAFWFLSLFTAPLALFLVFRHWKDGAHLHPPSKVRFLCAALAALVQVLAWLTLLVFLINQFSKLPSSE